jgi:hypothetical protein
MNSNSTERCEIRKFGLIALILFGFLFALNVWRGNLLPALLFGALSVLGLGFIVMPIPLRRVYHAWRNGALFVGKIVTSLLLTIAYYLVITPSALLKRLFGGDLLPLKPDKKASSYWTPRSEPAQPKERFLKRY